MRFLLFAFFCLGCGGHLTTENDASTGGDASTANDALSDAAPAPDAPPPPADGGVRSLLAFENGNGQGIFIGEFFTTTQQMNAGCQKSDFGACSIYTCPSASPQTLPNAGTLTIAIGSATSTLTQDPTGYYSKSGIAFAKSDVLGVSASGGDVPAFAMQTVTSPGPISIPPQTPSTISTSQDFTVTWSGGESGAQVLVEVVAIQNNASTGIACTFDATAGTGTIPQAQLASIQGNANGQLFYGQQRKMSFASGTFTIDLSAIQYTAQPVTFQ